MTVTNTTKPGRRAAPRCRLCVAHGRYNAETVAAVREADRIVSAIASGKRKPLSLDEMLAEISAV